MDKLNKKETKKVTGAVRDEFILDGDSPLKGNLLKESPLDGDSPLKGNLLKESPLVNDAEANRLYDDGGHIVASDNELNIR